MAWSIFSDGGGAGAALQWANELLTYMNLPVTPANVQFIYDWEVAEGGGGKFNPLNQGPVPGQPQLTTTGQQYGGGAADFASVEAGIQGAAAYIQMGAYSGILNALKNGNDYGAAANALWSSSWASSHYGYGKNWPTTAAPGTASAIVGDSGAATGMAGSAGSFGAAGGQATGGPPPISDINALDTYVRQNFGSDAWLLDIPEIKSILESAVAAGDDAGQIQAKIMQTTWWKTTSQAMQAFDALAANTPAELDFNSPGSQAARQLADVRAAAAKAGVTISDANAQQFALDMMKYGWDANQLQAAVANTIWVKAAPPAGAKPGDGRSWVLNSDAGAVINQLQAAQGQYFMNYSPQVLQSWAQNIAAGTQTIDQFTAQLKQDASLKWTGMAPQISKGYTPNQIVDNMRQEAAKTLEVDPSSVNFVNNPTYSKILDYVPPGTKDGVHRIMTLSEMDQYLKATPQFAGTQQARDQVGALADKMLTTFGQVAP
jgi:hypothetical protein